MNKIYYSLGLKSGTSSDGVDASIIKSDGENELKIIDNLYKKYDQNLKNSMHQLVNEIRNLEDLKKKSEELKKIERDLTIEHANLSSLLIDKNKDIHVDFIGFHGLTLFTWGSVLIIGLISKYLICDLKSLSNLLILLISSFECKLGSNPIIKLFDKTFLNNSQKFTKCLI